MKTKPLSPAQALAAIKDIIDSVANRCLACDGPAGSEREEITEAEFRAIYLLTIQPKSRRK